MNIELQRFEIKETCKEGRSPFFFKDEVGPPKQQNGSDSDSDGDGDEKSTSQSPSYFELRSALSRSSSELEEQQAADSLQELAALAAKDKMSDMKKPDSTPVPKDSSSKVSPESINALLQIVQQKMKKILLSKYVPSIPERNSRMYT